ncbi:MAG: hypothetical protein QMC78_02635 [Methanocellales archaeon]|nr:hypothetical protein [Methanocellales archaeon]
MCNDDIEGIGEQDPEKNIIGICDKCGADVDEADEMTCPVCGAVFHEWCIRDVCSRCGASFESETLI